MKRIYREWLYMSLFFAVGMTFAAAYAWHYVNAETTAMAANYSFIDSKAKTAGLAAFYYLFLFLAGLGNLAVVKNAYHFFELKLSLRKVIFVMAVLGAVQVWFIFF